MSAGEWALVVVAIVGALVALVAAVLLGVLVIQLRRAVGELQRATAAFSDRSATALDELVRAARSAGGQVDRLDDLISVASSVSETVDGATQATVRVLSNPVIKTAAIAKGTGRAARRLRSGRRSGR